MIAAGQVLGVSTFLQANERAFLAQQYTMTANLPA